MKFSLFNRSFLKKRYVFFREAAFLILDFCTYLIYKAKALPVQVDSQRQNTALVLGNGPSLLNFLEKTESDLSNSELYVCNGFAITNYYEKLKPKYYSLLDPLYFDLNDSRVVSKSINILEIWEAIFNKTNWHVTIYTSLSSTNLIQNIKNRFGENLWISWINIYPVKFYGPKKNYFYSKRIGLIGGINVVHLSLQVSLLKKYKKIYMAGVDHDWVENIGYDDTNHKVFLKNKHFFDESRLYYGEGVLKNIDLQIEFKSFAQTLSEFKSIVSFADYYGVKIYRCSRSFIHFIPYEQLPQV